MVNPGAAVSVIEGEQVLGCGGLIVEADGSAKAWTLLSDALRSRPVFLTRTARRMLAAAEHIGIGCIEITVHPDFPAAHRWAEYLGFTRLSGTVRQGRDGANYARYVR